MTTDLPDAPDGWRATETSDGRPRFDSEDRTLTVICTAIVSSGDTLWNCRLYESDGAYQMGNPQTSAMAEEYSDITDAVRDLDPDQ
jgi:hypothetical protein